MENNPLPGFMFQLVTYPNPILNEESLPVTKDQLEDVKKMIRPMERIMEEYGGVGLSAIQIGVKMRFAILTVGKPDPYNKDSQKVLTIINPEILTHKEPTEFDEGCLSLPLYKDKTLRFNRITIKYTDLDWNEQTIDLEGTEAQCVQHELGHMNGRLLVDHDSTMKKQMYVKKLQKARKYGKIRY